MLISAIDLLLQDLLEEQYGERYAQKLEERLSDYLEELNKALQHPTHIEQVRVHTSHAVYVVRFFH